MSTFVVKVVKIDDVMIHPGADRLELVKINDWQCVSAKGNFKKGDLAVYFPIDAIIPEDVEAKIFGDNSKVKLHNSRVKTIKLRGALSQGLVVPPEAIGVANKLGKDVTKELGVTKYEPQVKTVGSQPKSSVRNSNPHFKKYTGIENAKNYPSVFTETELVVVTEKLHGTSFRCGYVPFYADSLFKKLKKLLGLAPTHEFVYGSHNVQLQSKLLYKGFYETNIYAEAVVKYKLKEILKPGQVVYGEVYGPSVQKGYHYGCAPAERKLVLFDVMVDGKYLDIIAAMKFVQGNNLPFVPILFKGPFNKEKILDLRDGDSVLAPSQKVREGVVVKPLTESSSYVGRKVLKYISDAYLLKNQDNESIAH